MAANIGPIEGKIAGGGDNAQPDFRLMARSAAPWRTNLAIGLLGPRKSAIFTGTGRNLPVGADAGLRACGQHGVGARHRRSAMLARIWRSRSRGSATSAIWKVA